MLSGSAADDGRCRMVRGNVADYVCYCLCFVCLALALVDRARAQLLVGEPMFGAQQLASCILNFYLRWCKRGSTCPHTSHESDIWSDFFLLLALVE